MSDPMNSPTHLSTPEFIFRQAALAEYGLFIAYLDQKVKAANLTHGQYQVLLGEIIHDLQVRAREPR